jgi:hypothetical protein
MEALAEHKAVGVRAVVVSHLAWWAKRAEIEAADGRSDLEALDSPRTTATPDARGSPWNRDTAGCT